MVAINLWSSASSAFPLRYAFSAAHWACRRGEGAAVVGASTHLPGVILPKGNQASPRLTAVSYFHGYLLSHDLTAQSHGFYLSPYPQFFRPVDGCVNNRCPGDLPIVTGDFVVLVL